ncbi:hypothetical protein SAMN04487850_0562 [Prevotella aff. ruminicola Tc2-24]|jgi:hypothetical protein|uniref:SGNH/GDSL hydrolase family protein n=1 Tax=Prevotella aff. ruminicola Tc2-24 TaxID=81582 RepID=A0A1I0MDI0_9BACT|nr:hypothetical protein [Prevotella aff. ruminicola Tc2-24]SEV86299.1 hypothetical protein SAMN04487850_0562 [Prevotella aff. ruminicola Tc2-24]
MIKRSILCFAVLFGIHLVIVLLNPMVGMATHQWQDNVIKAQQFIYAEKSDTVMVGTSLSARIIRDSIPTVKSVSFGGCAVEDGLRIILSKGDLPRFILAETNLFFLDGNPELVSKMTEGVMPMLRRWIPSLREQYQPICMLASMMASAADINPQAGTSTVDMDLLNESIEHHIKYDWQMPEPQAETRMGDMKRLVEMFEAKGTRVLFFEMPVNERLTHLKRYDQTRELMQKTFPADRYTYLPFDTTRYVTTDGEHLDYEGQQVFSHYFKGVLSDLGRSAQDRN